MAQLKIRSILVVGGTGFIGTNLVKKLLKLGSKVTTLSLKRKLFFIKKLYFTTEPEVDMQLPNSSKYL